eukprot:2309163-Amphidinium_carterae.1
MLKNATSLSPNFGSIPSKLFSPIEKTATVVISRMPLSGSAPANWFLLVMNTVTSLRQLSGSIP